MREIEFRYIWRRLADGHLYTTITPIECLEGKGDTPFLGNEQWELVSRDQFCGLTDKNGVKVFEGDIVEFNSKENVFIEIGMSPNKPPRKMRSAVTFEDGCFLFRWQYGYEGLEVTFDKTTVIGNVHENGDLLK